MTQCYYANILDELGGRGCSKLMLRASVFHCLGDFYVVNFFYFDGSYANRRRIILDCFASRDHAGGNDKMKQLVPDIKIYGGSLDNVQGCTNKVESGDKLSLGDHINILSLHTPWYWLH